MMADNNNNSNNGNDDIVPRTPTPKRRLKPIIRLRLMKKICLPSGDLSSLGSGARPGNKEGDEGETKKEHGDLEAVSDHELSGSNSKGEGTVKNVRAKEPGPGPVKYEDEDEEVATNRYMRSKKHEMPPVKWPGPDPPPGLPMEVEDMVEEMGGSKLSLLIQMVLTEGDMNMEWGRLAMEMTVSRLQVTKEEKDDMKAWDERKKEMKGKNVRVIEPKREANKRIKVTRLNLQRWDNLDRYVFTGNWNGFRKRHELKVGDFIQVWTFRVRDGNELCFAIVKLP